MEELEKDFLKEIKPLVNEYLNYANLEMPGLWNDSRAITMQEREEKVYGVDREGEILKILDEGKIYDRKLDDVIPIPLNTRRDLIEELARN